LAALNGDTNPAFIPSREELRGDLLKQTGDIVGAQKAYQAATKVLVERQESRPLLEMKMADVGLEIFKALPTCNTSKAWTIRSERDMSYSPI
jgi:hypothetical protein